MASNSLLANTHSVVRVAAGKRVATASELATWRDDTGQVKGRVRAGTMCWTPRRPWRLRITNGDYQHIVPCGECPGCMLLARQRLADRLRQRYQDKSARLYVVEIDCPVERQARLARNLHRSRRLDLEPGFFRLGPDRVAVIARSRANIAAFLRKRHVDHTISRVRLGRRRRAWRAITRGLSYVRAAYGKNLNRFYQRGLPRLEKPKWEILKGTYGRGYDKRISARAWRDDNLVLVPPEVWKTRPAHALGIKRLKSYLHRQREALSSLAVVAAEKAAGPGLRSLPDASEQRGYRSSVHMNMEVPEDIADIIGRLMAKQAAKGRPP